MKTNQNQGILPQLKARNVPLARRLAIAGAVVATLGLGSAPSINPHHWGECSATSGGRSSTSAGASWRNGLGSSRTGRVVLHTMCLLRHPERASWHWQGIVRELAA